MSKKITDVIAYLGFVGLIVAFIFGSREESKFHLNQALVLYIAIAVFSGFSSFLKKFPGVGVVFSFLVGLFTLGIAILWVIGIVRALTGSDKRVPILGTIRLYK